MATAITISAFIKSISPLITEEALGYVCAKCRLTGEEVLSQYAGESYIDGDGNARPVLTERQQDLAEGTAYYWLANLPVGGATEKVADGNFSRSEGGWTVSKANIDAWLQKYRQLFEKWDETPLDRSRIRIINW